MNIIIINHYAGAPSLGMEYRPYYFAQEWIKFGHSVTIIAASHSHLRSKNPAIKNSLEEEVIDGVKYIWIKTPEYHGNGLGRTKNMFVFIRKMLSKAKYFAKNIKPDAVIASSTYPSDNYVARKIAKHSGSKFIYEVHDLWPLSPMELGNMSKFHPFIMVMQHAENFAYRNADYVVSMLPNTKEHMQNHGLDLKKWHYIPNGIVLKDWSEPEALPDILDNKIKELKRNDYFIVAYTGGHAPSNSLDTFINAAVILEEHKDIFFLLVGNGIEKEKLISQAKNLTNVLFFDSIPKLAIPTVLKAIDIAVIGSIKSPLYRFGVSPNKLIDYMMAGKPVIQYIEAGNDIVQEADAGISVESGNPNAIADAILQLKSIPKEELNKKGKNGQQFVKQNHDYSILAEQFIKIIE